MGGLGMSFQEAKRFPHNQFWNLWEAHQRRLSRLSLHYMDDLIAVSGLQGEMKEVGTAPKMKKSANKMVPIGYQKHVKKRMKEAYPMKRVWTKQLEKKAQESFWAGIDDLPVINLTKEEEGGNQEA